MKKPGRLARRTPLRARVGLRRVAQEPIAVRKPLRAVQGRLRARSERRAAEIDGPGGWRDLKMAVFARDAGRCRAEPLPTGITCWGRIDPHHVEPVGEGGAFLPGLDGVASLCRAHHDWSHGAGRAAAEALGLIRRPGR